MKRMGTGEKSFLVIACLLMAVGSAFEPALGATAWVLLALVTLDRL